LKPHTACQQSIKDTNVGDFTATRSGFEFRISKLEHDNRRLKLALGAMAREY
jgi:hypothetical protein